MIQEIITNLEETIQRNYSNITGIVILKNGKPLYENTFNGYTAADPVHVCSVTKSIISLLIGIALDGGYIQSVNQKVLDFFPEYTVKRGEKTIQTITLKHLLTMTAPYKFRFAPYTKVFSSADWVMAALDYLGGKKPAGTFRYMEMIGPDILSGILVRATGRSVLSFAQQALFQPLAINVSANIDLETKEKHMAFFKTKPAKGWVADGQGTNTAGWGLTLTAMDMAKIGQLCLNGGSWQGKQLVSPAWIKECTTEHSRWPKENLPYGYLWWLGIGNGGYAAIGNSGNVIYVNPAQSAVLSITASFKPTAKDVIPLIQQQIDPIMEV